MHNTIFRLSVLTHLTCLATPAVGSGTLRRHEILLNSSDYGLNSVAFGGGTVVKFGGGYQYRLIAPLQLGLRTGIIFQDVSSVSTTAFILLGGATLNFPFHWEFEETFFAGLNIGLSHASVAGFSSTPFVIDLELGKRFQIFHNVAYRPTFELLIPSNGGKVSVGLKLLAISFVF